MEIKVIKAGNCIICGREIKIGVRRGNNKTLNIFFCQRCVHRVSKEKYKAESEDEESE